MPRPIRVVIVDDSSLMREMLRSIISEEPGIEVAGVARDPYEAREVIKQTNPDVITLDIEMPRMDGLSFLEKIMTLRPTPVVMVSSLTQEGSDATIRALEIGAVDCVAKPDGLLVVEPDGELRFLHSLPVGRLWGVGPVTQRKLHERGVHTGGEVAALGEANLVAMLGAAAGHHLFALAHNRDPRPIETGRRRKSIGAQHALGRGPRDVAEIEPLLLGLVDKVARRLRTAQRRGRTVTVRLRFGDMVAITRARTLAHASDNTTVLADVAVALLREQAEAVQARGSSLIGVSVGDLVDSARSDDSAQLTLTFGTKPTDGLDRTLDELRERYGAAAITRGSLLGRPAGFEAPKLPD